MRFNFVRGEIKRICKYVFVCVTAQRLDASVQVVVFIHVNQDFKKKEEEQSREVELKRRKVVTQSTKTKQDESGRGQRGRRHWLRRLTTRKQIRQLLGLSSQHEQDITQATCVRYHLTIQQLSYYD